MPRDCHFHSHIGRSIDQFVSYSPQQLNLSKIPHSNPQNLLTLQNNPIDCSVYKMHTDNSTLIFTLQTKKNILRKNHTKHFGPTTVWHQIQPQNQFTKSKN